MSAVSQPLSTSRTIAERNDDPALQKMLDLQEEMRQTEATFRQRFRDTLEPHIKAEFINGQIIMDSPARLDHTDTLGNLLALARLHVQVKRAGVVLFEKALVKLQRDDVEPDMCYWDTNASAGFKAEQYMFPPPTWAVEILSPSSVRRDRTEKFLAYQDAGVREYWLLDANVRCLEPFILTNGKYEAVGAGTDQESLVGPDCLPDLRFPLRALFDAEANLEAMKRVLASS
jgi:Uma2 family endonuclease